jgi:hypothetical protein
MKNIFLFFQIKFRLLLYRLSDVLSSGVIKRNNTPVKRSFPEAVGKYRLSKQMHHLKSFNIYSHAIYTDNKGNKYFAKAWFGNSYDSAYFWLKNEIYVYESALFVNKTGTHKYSPSSISIPKFECCYENDKCLILLCEYISNPQNTSDPDKIIDYYNSAIRFMHSYSTQFHKRLKSRIFQIRPFYLILSIPLMSVILLFNKPKYFKHLLNITGYLFLNLSGIFHGDWNILIHRDLRESIIKTRNQLYLVDWQTAVFSHPAMELASLICTYWENNRIGIKATELGLYRETVNNLNSFKIFKILCFYTLITEILLVKTKSDEDELSLMRYLLNIEYTE